MFLRSNRHADGDLIDIGEARVRLRVNRRARRVSLRLDRALGEVVAIAPSQRRLGDAAAFALERRDWIEGRLAQLPAKRPLAPGVAIALFGRPCRLGWAPGRLSLEGDGWERGARLTAGADAAAYARAAVALIKREALIWFEPRCERHCQVLGAETPKISMMGARTRWGSCTSGGGRPASIRLSWRLALAPPAVADYVAAHECAHLLHANHGPRFWIEVRRLIGDERPHRAWLRGEGQALHGYDER